MPTISLFYGIKITMWLDNWQRAQNRQPLNWIEPLR